MSLKFSTLGRPLVECINPNCGKLHPIHRKGDYVKKASIYVKCRSCGTKWKLTEKEKDQLKNHFEQRQAELEEKRKKKEEKIQKKEEKPEPTKEHKEPEKKEKPKKSWLDSLLD